MVGLFPFPFCPAPIHPTCFPLPKPHACCCARTLPFPYQQWHTYILFGGVWEFSHHLLHGVVPVWLFDDNKFVERHHCLVTPLACSRMLLLLLFTYIPTPLLRETGTSLRLSSLYRACYSVVPFPTTPPCAIACRTFPVQFPGSSAAYLTSLLISPPNASPCRCPTAAYNLPKRFAHHHIPVSSRRAFLVEFPTYAAVPFYIDIPTGLQQRFILLVLLDLHSPSAELKTLGSPDYYPYPYYQ